MSKRIVGDWEREKSTFRTARLRVEAERCAARTKSGTQCTKGLWSGEGGGHYVINGERVPLCTLHLRMALNENWESTC